MKKSLHSAFLLWACNNDASLPCLGGHLAFRGPPSWTEDFKELILQEIKTKETRGL
jgi:hypothetical protein